MVGNQGIGNNSVGPVNGAKQSGAISPAASNALSAIKAESKGVEAPATVSRASVEQTAEAVAALAD